VRRARRAAFGAAHVANVLCGSESEQVTKRGHQQLSTFGLLRDAAVPEVRGYIEQITAEGCCARPTTVSRAALTEAGRALLKDAGARPDLSLARQRRVTKDRRPRASAAATEAWKDVDHDLFDRLRAVRLRIARERGVPPYVIFHDTTLRELARLKPMRVEELHSVYGIGARKAEQLGQAFVDEIREFAATR
jgi:ATP-dependent DNA helicase RecQ